MCEVVQGSAGKALRKQSNISLLKGFLSCPEPFGFQSELDQLKDTAKVHEWIANRLSLQRAPTAKGNF